MKIYIDHEIHPKIRSLGNNIEDARYWNSSVMSLFELAESDDPDIIFVTEKEVNKYLQHFKESYPNVKLVLASEAYIPNDLIDYNIEIDKMPTLLDEKLFSGGEEVSRFKTKLLFISNQKITEEHSIWLASIGNKYQLKIYGEQIITCPNYLGNIDLRLVKHAIASAEYVITFDPSQVSIIEQGGSTPLLYSESPNNPNEFSSYEELESLVESEVNYTKESFMTCKEYFDQIIKEIL